MNYLYLCKFCKQCLRSNPSSLQLFQSLFLPVNPIQLSKYRFIFFNKKNKKKIWKLLFRQSVTYQTIKRLYKNHSVTYREIHETAAADRFTLLRSSLRQLNNSFFFLTKEKSFHNLIFFKLFSSKKEVTVTDRKSDR